MADYKIKPESQIISDDARQDGVKLKALGPKIRQRMLMTIAGSLVLESV